MAITARIQWLEHAIRMVKFVLVRHPECVPAFIEGAVQYVQMSSYDTLVNRRDAARIAINILNQEVLNAPDSPHERKHLLSRSGVAESFLEDVPNMNEPSI